MDVSNYSRTTHIREHLCGYDLNLTYPQSGVLPTVVAIEPNTASYIKKRYKTPFTKNTLKAKIVSRSTVLTKRSLGNQEHAAARRQWKRDLPSSGTINPWYGCDLLDEIVDYAINFTFPWCGYPLFFIRDNDIAYITRFSALGQSELDLAFDVC